MILLIMVTLSCGLASAGQLHVYDPVPGLAPSPFYSMRLRLAGEERLQPGDGVQHWDPV